MIVNGGGEWPELLQLPSLALKLSYPDRRVSAGRRE
jgi:hypothetical protein